MSEFDVEGLQRALQHFADASDWEQFHTPKNLASALSVEAAELLKIYQWLDEAQSRAVGPGHPLHKRVAAEMADAQIYFRRLADNVSVDLDDAFGTRSRATRRSTHRRRPKAAKGGTIGCSGSTKQATKFVPQSVLVRTGP